MEGHRSDDQENTPPEYTGFQLRSFDDPEDSSEKSLVGLPAPGSEFQVAIEPEAATGAEFTETALEGEREKKDFGSIQFQRENTLLTNAESYAASVREEAQLYVRQMREEVESLNVRAEQRYEEALKVKEEAEAEAARIVSEAEAGVVEINEKARAEGFEAGRQEGLARRYEEVGEDLKRFEAILKEISQFRKRVAFYTEKDGVRLALLIARKILRTELKINKQAVMRLLATTLSKLEGKGTFHIWLNPQDHEFLLAARPTLERYLDDSQTLALRAKPDIEPGNVLVETDREVIDLSFESQFYHLDRSFRQTLAERDSVLTRSSTPAPPPRPPPQARPFAEGAPPPRDQSNES